MSFSPTTSRARLVPIFLGQAIGLACGVIGIRINSHLIPPDFLGVYGLFLTLVPIGMWVVHAGLVKFTARHWAGASARHTLARGLLVHWTRRLPWLALAALPAAWAVARLTPVAGPILGLALFLAASLLALASIAQTALQAEQTHWRDCAVSAVGSLSRTFFPPLLFVATGAGVALWGGFTLHAAVTAGVAWSVLLRGLGPTPETPASPPPLSSIYEGPLFNLLAASAWLLAGINRWLVAGFFGDHAAGLFTLAGGAAVVVTSTPGTALLQYFQPGFFTLGDSGERAALARRVDRAALLYTVLAATALGTLAYVAPSLVGWLISPDYRNSLPWLLPAGCFGIATITAVYYHTLLLAGRRELACGPVDLTTAAILIGGSLLTATLGSVWFSRWLLLTPLVPWLITRPLARHFFFKPAEPPASAPAR